jgi:hypothetical protein
MGSWLAAGAATYKSFLGSGLDGFFSLMTVSVDSLMGSSLRGLFYALWPERS